MFTGFPEETIRFFLDLRFHNEISFYKAHEADYYEYVRKPFDALIEELAPAMRTIALDMETRPGQCLARIRRDTRFTKDKSPYRDHLWLLFRRGGESRDTCAMYWFELSPDQAEWGLGFWGQNRPAMDALRRRMERKPKEVLRALHASGIPDENLKIFGERYQRMKIPDGLPPELAALYPLKQIYVKRVNTSLQMCYQSELADTVRNDFLRLKPMYALLRSVADEGMAQLDA